MKIKKTSRFTSFFFGLSMLLTLTSCVSKPDDITPVSNFELKKYLGKWYEIARLDHAFERGLSSVSAEYSLREDGGLKVVNKGFLAKKNQWKSAEGKAYFVNKKDEGYLKVSFFGPFYGSYIVFELDDNYQYAFIAGPNKDYLWLLARTPNPSQEVKDKFLRLAKEKGYDLSDLIFPEHKLY